MEIAFKKNKNITDHFKGLSLNQTKSTIFERASPTLNVF